MTNPVTRPALLIAAALLAGPPGAALAAQPGPDWMPIDQVARKVGEAGYADIRSLKADDGFWKGKASREGRPVAFTVDPRSGAVTERVKPGKEAKSGKEARTEDEGDD